MVRADIVLVTLDHFDHNCVRIVKGEPTIVRDAGGHNVKGSYIVGHPIFHDHESVAKRGLNIIYTLTCDGFRFCHCGDLGQMLPDEQMRVIEPVDVLFVPVGGVFTKDGREARELISRMRPKVAVPMHHR